MESAPEGTNALLALSHFRASRNRLVGCASSVTIAFLSRGNCTVFPPFSCLFVEIGPGIIVAAIPRIKKIRPPSGESLDRMGKHQYNMYVRLKVRALDTPSGCYP